LAEWWRGQRDPVIPAPEPGLHTYAERFRAEAENRGTEVPHVDGVQWLRAVTHVPADASEIEYHPEAGVVTIGDGQLRGVRPEVWAYSVSGMPVVGKWLRYRTAKGAGRATSSSSELDKVRPSEWHDDWNDELLDLIRVLTITLDRQADLDDLVNRVCDGPLIPASELPIPSESEREPPVTIQRF
jgi:hypothetical protein